MKSADQWFEEYGQSHQNPVNKLIHFICVPTIMFTLLGMFWAISPKLFGVFVLGSCIFYAITSFRLALGMLGVLLIMLAGIFILDQLDTLFWTCFVIFILAWIGQFIGHKIEGKKPSFFEDLLFLLIGPLWILGFIYRKASISY